MNHFQTDVFEVITVLPKMKFITIIYKSFDRKLREKIAYGLLWPIPTLANSTVANSTFASSTLANSTFAQSRNYNLHYYNY